ncbi:MAG TPA: MBL fold metallo-hydrolase [Chryseosolibacter sp.]
MLTKPISHSQEEKVLVNHSRFYIPTNSFMANAAKKTVRKTAKKISKNTKSKSNAVLESVKIRMYRAGTGDCFLLQFQSNGKTTRNVMIDCGCIRGGRNDFEPMVEDIRSITNDEIDILIVTHEHADHINGFASVSDLFDKIRFKKVWFAWTEDETDDLANDLRKNHTKIKLALQAASTRLTGLIKSKHYENRWTDDFQSALMVESKKHFINSLSQLNALNFNNTLGVNKKIPSMVELFEKFNVIKADTEVECLRPGELIKNISALPGLRVFVLGPPRDMELLDTTEEHGESYEKREKASSRDFAFAAAMLNDGQGTSILPFEPEFEMQSDGIKTRYETKDTWRQIENDWLYTAGSIALRYQRSINNTSLVLAFQFEESERVLLFPGDAEFGNWKSWHDGLSWSIPVNGKNKKVNAEYLLNNTVFYKVGHHCSHNGSASTLGVEMMTHEDLTVMAPLSFKKINTGWLNTMPNDILCANLISKAKGKMYFSGDYRQILPNIKTKRVTVTKTNEEKLVNLNKEYDGSHFIECEVSGK